MQFVKTKAYFKPVAVQWSLFVRQTSVCVSLTYVQLTAMFIAKKKKKSMMLSINLIC